MQYQVRIKNNQFVLGLWKGTSKGERYICLSINCAFTECSEVYKLRVLLFGLAMFNDKYDISFVSTYTKTT